MLPIEERLRKKKDFNKVFKLKCSVATSCVIAYILKKDTNNSIDSTKVAFVVSKKIHKKSTQRNKIKRRMREAYRIIRTAYPDLIKNFESIIFIARPNIDQKDYFDIYSNILNCLHKTQKFIDNTTC